MEYKAYLYLIGFTHFDWGWGEHGRHLLTRSSKIDSADDITSIEEMLSEQEGVTDVAVFAVTLLDEWTRDTPVDWDE